MIQTGSPLQTGKNAKYMQLADWIAERIHSGEFAPGTRLPSNRKLAGQWNLSAITITAAMDELVRRRLIVRRRGSGTAMRRRLRQKQTRKEPDNRYDRHDTAHASKLFLSLSHDPPGRASGAGSEADSPYRCYYTQFLYSNSPLLNSGSI